MGVLLVSLFLLDSSNRNFKNKKYISARNNDWNDDIIGQETLKHL